jgi:phosphatidylglycerophosphate synthase
MEAAIGRHRRHNESLTARLEKRVLVWLAERAPSWVHSDHLTALGLLGTLFAALAFFVARFDRLALVAAVLALAVNWLGDSLDGTLARVRKLERPRYGYYVDHVVDVVGAAALLTGMGLSGFMSPWVAAGLLLAFLVVTAETFLATHALGVFRMSFAWLGPTEVRLLLAAGALRLLVKPDVTLAGTRYLLLDVGGVGAILGFGVVFVASVVRNSRTLGAQEPL